VVGTLVTEVEALVTTGSTVVVASSPLHAAVTQSAQPTTRIRIVLVMVPSIL
jgi:hypothetical protein